MLQSRLYCTPSTKTHYIFGQCTKITAIHTESLVVYCTYDIKSIFFIFITKYATNLILIMLLNILLLAC